MSIQAPVISEMLHTFTYSWCWWLTAYSGGRCHNHDRLNFIPPEVTSDYSQFTAVSRVSFDIQECRFYASVIIIHTKAARICPGNMLVRHVRWFRLRTEYDHKDGHSMWQDY